jgi:peptide/nickel transport system substrate-binding protein
VIAPQHIFSQVADLTTFANETPVGTGPFTEVGRFENQIFELLANPELLAGRQAGDPGLRMPTYPSNDAVQLAGVNGELDWQANFIPDIEKTYVEKDPEHHKLLVPAIGDVVHLYLNTEVLRSTTSMCARPSASPSIATRLPDRDVRLHPPGRCHRTQRCLEGWKDETAKSADWVTYDVDRANQVLDDAGFARDGDVRKGPDGRPSSSSSTSSLVGRTGYRPARSWPRT